MVDEILQPFLMFLLLRDLRVDLQQRVLELNLHAERVVHEGKHRTHRWNAVAALRLLAALPTLVLLDWTQVLLLRLVEETHDELLSVDARQEKVRVVDHLHHLHASLKLAL